MSELKTTPVIRKFWRRASGDQVFCDALDDIDTLLAERDALKTALEDTPCSCLAGTSLCPPESEHSPKCAQRLAREALDALTKGKS